MSRACDDAMREDDLVEQVQKHIVAVADKNSDWSDVAREVVRLMEWARRADRTVFVTEHWERHPDGKRTLTTTVKPPPLTLPPPDWQP